MNHTTDRLTTPETRQSLMRDLAKQRRDELLMRLVEAIGAGVLLGAFVILVLAGMR